MLYGNLIFIKKTGGDGSKYPVTEKNIKIGRSENCMIRIYTPQVAPEHCQLIIDNSGQAKLRNLFTPTILNGKPLGQGDVTLCHGDVFKLGERLARWEYLPTSKYFKQLLSPTGRLVAVVNPQRRSVEISGTSATQVSVSKSTPVGNKRKFSEKFGSDNSSAAKQRKTAGLDGSLKPKIDLTKLLIGRHSIKTGKSILKTPTLKQRKSVSGMIDSRTSKNKAKNHRKSTLPSWKVSVDAQPQQSAQKKKSPSRGAVKTPSKQSLKNEVRTPSKSTPIKVKTPKRLKLEPKSGDKTLLNTILESPPKLVSVRSTRSCSKSPPAKVLSTPKPKPKSSVRAVRLVQSEKKSEPSLGTPTLRGLRKMSLALNKVDGGRRKSLLQKNSTLGRKSAKEGKIAPIENGENEAHVQESSSSNVTESRKSSGKSDASFDFTKQTCRKSAKSAAEKTPRNFSKPPNQSSVKKATLEIVQTPPLIDFSDKGDSVSTKRTSRKSVISSRKSLQKSVRKSSADIYQIPQKFLNKVASPNIEKPNEEPSRSAVVSPVSTPPRSRKSGNVTSSKKVVSSSKDKKVSPTGVRRKLSRCIFSAERAAKKLKTSSPKKPDKNKRAALLVLGKASRKQLLSQNVKVLLKQKIVKKAIKQSAALPMKDEKQKMSVKKIQKSLRKKAKKCAKVSSSRFSQSVKKTLTSNKLSRRSINESENDTPNVIKSKISSPVPPARVAVSTTEFVKSPTKKTESILTPKTTEETISPLIKFDKSSESYVFDSSRRCSKRLSSKNDTERPDFVELSPTALGLIPKNIEMFKTPKEKKRKSSSLVTPRNVMAAGIIKSASTSKIINRKSVSFSSKDFPLTATAYTPTTNEKTDFDFDSFHTSNITMDVFVSPLNKSSETPIVSNENVEPSEKGSTPNSKKVVRKLLESPPNDSSSKLLKFSDQAETPSNSVSGSDVEKPVVSPRSRSSPKNDLTDVRGVKKLFDTPKVQRSKNDLSDVKEVKKLMQTPRVQKSPKNELSDLRGVKRLMRTPKVQKSPRNELSDLRGVKRLMQTPKVQKSPRNELSDLRGVKRLMRTPKVQKSPRNELSDLRGVKRLMRTPKKQKSPKNELSDLRGVKRLLRSPKNQKSPKNDLTDVRGIKRLLKTPKSQKSPQNNLSDVEGIEELFASPQESKSPRRVNKASKSSENGLLDVTGVRELFARHKPISDYDVNLNGVAELFDKLSAEEDSNKSPGVSETKTTVRGRRRKLDDEKEQQVATPKTRARRESENVKKPRVTRSTKLDVAADIEEISKRAGVGARKTARVKTAEPARKISRKKVDSKKEIETPKAGVSKTLRKRKLVEAVEVSPPKLRRKAAGSEQSALKVKSAEPKTIAVRSKTRKAEEKEEAESLKKPGGKSKTPAKKAVRGQSKGTKSGASVVPKTQKVQKGRSQTAAKQESLRSGNISPKTTRSVSARKTTQKTRVTATKS